MPELPEIETIKLQLQKHLVGEMLEKLEKLHPKSVQGDIELIRGIRVRGVRRIGKMLVLELEKGLNIAIHFKMSGQLILVYSSKFIVHSRKKENQKRIVGGHPTQDWTGELPSKHTRAIFHFKNGDEMYFNDQRIFGWIKILDDKSLRSLKFLKNLGKEPWDIEDEEFFLKIHNKNRAIKLVIMDQEIISGVGNIYANDGLWEAKIDPRKKAKDLKQEDSKTLRQSLIKVLREGIKYGGATASDAKYVDLRGLGGHYQEHFRTYDREGDMCLRKDGGIIKKIKLGGRGTYYCSVCQI
jgi:formamidopyrimidine-DNA glycosylase